MNKVDRLFIFLFFTSSLVFSQTVSRDAISSQGSFDQNEILSLEWTLGDTFGSTVMSKNKMLTQGFNQSFLLISQDLSDNSIKIKVFPNPVQHYLNIKTYPEYGSRVTILLYDMSGKLVFKNDSKIDEYKLSIDIHNLDQGTYILKLINENGSQIDTHSIIKN